MSHIYSCCETCNICNCISVKF